MADAPLTEPHPAASGPQAPRTHRRTRLFIVAVAVFAMLAAAGMCGYFVGKSGGEDIDAARKEGERQGQLTGTSRGNERGYKAGYLEGRARGYRQTYRRAYRRAYEAALEA